MSLLICKNVIVVFLQLSMFDLFQNKKRGKKKQVRGNCYCCLGKMKIKAVKSW